MGDTVIKVENLSKLYRLGVWGTGTLKDDLKKNFAKWTGRNDPTVMVGSSNQLDTVDQQEVWALKDINFEVKQGEVLGIIGKNGAGKSTLLKILSEITAPTTGAVKIKGRVASLLEVGTGMHPELTGRENIFLNGAILGMRRWEIKSKFDEIVDFAGIAKYIDTPIKRYSSGMRVRLGFAIAAFLEPEILIVDEVLAVGDADFQKRAIGKIQEVSEGQGRTVLFVSHNMTSIIKLCNKSILLKDGLIHKHGNTSDVLDYYLKNNILLVSSVSLMEKDRQENELVSLVSARISTSLGKHEVNFNYSECIILEIDYSAFVHQEYITAIIHIKDSKDNVVLASNEFEANDWEIVHSSGKHTYNTKCKIPSHFLNEGFYSVMIAFGSYSPNIIHNLYENILGFKITYDGSETKSVKSQFTGKWPGIVRPKLEWNVRAY